MPGLLTSVFGDDGSSSSQSQSYDAGADGGVDLSPSIGVSHHAEGDYEGLDGSSNHWTSDTDVGLDTQIVANLTAAGSADQTSTDTE